MSRETAPGSAGPRVSDERLAGHIPNANLLDVKNEAVRAVFTDIALDLRDARAALASLRAQNADLLASEKQRNENICTECGCPRLAKGECLMCENATLRAQNERLREALEDALEFIRRDLSRRAAEDGSPPLSRAEVIIAAERALASTDTGETP